ncbi:MAG: PorT family protein [Bacteroidia bacterium]|nr:PorT family protein [Bacteroidia bacterium]MCF8427418.1 PorT family protein [Bacteroidia bacterium]MCF8447284.1 PorT family protein [Bacteroidia bacterium]
MKYLLLLIGNLFYLFGTAQELAISKFRSEPKTYSIGFQGGGNLNSIRRFNAKGDESTDIVISLFDKITHVKLGYSFGFSGSYQLNNTLELEMGLHFYDRGYALKRENFIYEDVIDPARGVVTNSSGGGSSPTSIKNINHFYYLELPLFTHFSYGKKRLRFVGSLGLSPAYLIETTLTNHIKYEDGTKSTLTQKDRFSYTKFNLFSSLGMGIEYAINSKTKIRVEPIFTYGLINISSSPVGANLWSSGLSFGVYTNLLSRKK